MLLGCVINLIAITSASQLYIKLTFYTHSLIRLHQNSQIYYYWLTMARITSQMTNH